MKQRHVSSHKSDRRLEGKTSASSLEMDVSLGSRLLFLRFLPLKHSSSFLKHWRYINSFPTSVLLGRSISRSPPKAVPTLRTIRYFTANRNDVPEPEDFELVCRSAFFASVNQKLSEDVLEEYFAVYGAVDKLYLIRNFRGQSRGHGLVVFRDAETMETVLEGTHRIDDSIFRAERSRKYRVVKVEGLPHNYSENEVRELFSQFGEVGEVEIRKSLDKKETNDYCLVSFSKQTEALEAVRNADNLGGEAFSAKLTLLSSMRDFTKLPSKRLVVHNLPYTTTVDEIYQHFQYPCPSIREIHLRLDFEKQTCLALLQFDDAEDTEKIVKAGTVQFGGREISFKKVNDSQPLNSTESAVFVENIPHGMSRDQVYHHFKEFGRTERVNVKENRGFGVVRYYLGTDALGACREKEHVINNNKVSVRRLTMKVPKKGF